MKKKYIYRINDCIIVVFCITREFFFLHKYVTLIYALTIEIGKFVFIL